MLIAPQLQIPHAVCTVYHNCCIYTSKFYSMPANTLTACAAIFTQSEIDMVGLVL